ncbi:MAG: serine/threonine-protein kinase [Actinomycetes bacterium]
MRPLGSGGMGHVWLARDEQTGLDVALKMVPREGKIAARAEREARAAAALRHPRCQRVYALARDPSHIFIAYEYIPGRTLRQALAAGELGDRDAVEVAAQLLEALAHAHERGIVHRDVKPSNVLLGEGDAIDVRLLDFGLAQMAEFDTLTAIGDVPGTLAYISPERLLGKNATAATDVWAVGVLLWEALAGHHPFRRDSSGETSRRIRAGAPALETIRPDLPARLRETVAQALVLDPLRRPSAGNLALDLRAHMRRRKRGSGGGERNETPPPARAKQRLAMSLPDRVVPAALAATWTGWVAAELPFYPSGFGLGLTAAAAAIGFLRPRVGIGLALAATFFPLANISLGLALLFAGLALLWTALSWNDTRGALMLVTGPLLAPLAALGFVPLVAQFARGGARRALQAAAAVLLALVVAGVGHRQLPFGAGSPPLGLGIAGSNRPSAVAYELWHTLSRYPALVTEALVLAAAAAAIPLLRGRGPWVAATGGGALLVVTAAAAPAAPLLPLLAAAWATAVVLALPKRA